jgi:phosphoribosyl 1,2-cyclic phosphodiesterase
MDFIVHRMETLRPILGSAILAGILRFQITPGWQVIRFSLLGSGSAGNAILVEAQGSKILVDNGLSFRQLERRSALVGSSLDDLKAVFITHEHTDHVQGLRVLCNKRPVPIYMTEGTFSNLPKSARDLPEVRHFEAGETVALNGLSLHSFSVSHDAADPVSYVVEAGGVRLGIAADMGGVSGLVRRRLEQCEALVLESNYCPQMLTRSSYPPSIRQRISSRHGHLSNVDACKLLSSVLHDALQLVVLVHISAENNKPELAREMAQRAVGSHQARVCVASQTEPTEMFEVPG